VLTGSRADDRIGGSAWNDRVQGLGGDDALSGAGRADTLEGGRGADTLEGGAGADLLRGGPGADVFVLAAAGDSAPGRADTIADLAPGDVIDLSALMPGGTFVGAAAFDGPGQVRFAGGRLSGDLDGDGRADWAIRLEGAPEGTADALLFG
jgi:Ca2+-binding RTX toxin-like protein